MSNFAKPVYVNDGISKSITVIQYGETLTVQNSCANFRLADDTNELRLYVSRVGGAREE